MRNDSWATELCQRCVEVTWKINCIAETCVVPLQVVYFFSCIHFALEYFDGSKVWHACTVVGELKSMYNLDLTIQWKLAPDCDLYSIVLEDSAVMEITEALH